MDWIAIYDPEESDGFTICRPTAVIREGDKTASVLFYKRIASKKHMIFRGIAYCSIKPEYIIGKIHASRTFHEDIECPELGVVIPKSIMRITENNRMSFLLSINKLIREKEQKLMLISH